MHSDSYKKRHASTAHNSRPHETKSRKSKSHKYMLNEPMAAVDHAWLRMDSPVNPMVINAVLTFKKPIDEDDFRKRVLDKFVSKSRFRCRPEPSAYGEHWQETEIEDDYHLPVESSPLESDSELQAVATEFINETLDFQKPLWRIMFVARFKRGSSIIVRIHHSYADGMALMKVLLQLMDEGDLFKVSDEGQNNGGDTNINKKSKSGSPNWLQEMQSFLPGQGRWFETLGLVEELSTELLKMGLSPGEENVFKAPGLCGKKQLVWTAPLDLSEVRTIAKVHNAKVNDVLLGSVAGAFRRHLKAINKLSSWSELRTMIPVDLRSQVNSQELGNYFGLVFLSLPLGIEDPIERALLLNKRMMALKESKQAWLVFQLLQLSGYLPDIAEKELIRLFSSKASAVITNVPGPTFPLHFTGSELDEVLFWVPQAGSIGTGVSILTYNNRVQFGLMTDKQLIETPKDIVDCFNVEFESLLLETLMTTDWLN